MAHREQDFDYEVIDHMNGDQEFLQTQVPMEEEDITIEEESSISVADHYKGTPPLKSKKNKRNSRDIPSDVQVKSGDDLPPPIPPKGKLPSPAHHMADTTTPTFATPTFDQSVSEQDQATPPSRPVRERSSREKSTPEILQPPQNLANSPVNR